MISVQDQIKINDFREAYRKAMNPKNDREINKVIDALFFNVQCMYEEYKDEVLSVSSDKEQYKFHILQPVNGKYSLLDFLINRAISNVDCINITDENAYDSSKALLINSKRYESKRPKYPGEADFIEKQYLKSKLHETGHALHAWDTKNDGAIHNAKKFNRYPNFMSFAEKFKIITDELGNKYSNILHMNMIVGVPENAYSIVKKRMPFDNHFLDEAVTEYYATKYAGLYSDKKYYKEKRTNYRNNEIAVTKVPNPFNGYADSARFMYHLENLVSKRAMFESIFFESDIALREFTLKYSEIINKLWSMNINLGYLPQINSTEERFKYLIKWGSNYEVEEVNEEVNEDIQKGIRIIQEMLDGIFIHAYTKKYSEGKISKEDMKKIAGRSYYITPVVYSVRNKNWNDAPVRKWYEDTYRMLAGGTDNSGADGR